MFRRLLRWLGFKPRPRPIYTYKPRPDDRDTLSYFKRINKCR